MLLRSFLSVLMFISVLFADVNNELELAKEYHNKGIEYYKSGKKMSSFPTSKSYFSNYTLELSIFSKEELDDEKLKTIFEVQEKKN